MARPQIRINGGAPGVKAVLAAFTPFTATLDDTAGVRAVEWSVGSVDDLSVLADYDLDPSGMANETVASTSLGVGTAGILKAKVNGGVDPQTGNPSNLMTATCKFFVPTATGLEVGAAGEVLESDAVSGSTGEINSLIRYTDSIVVGSSGGDRLPVRVATTENIVLSGAQDIDGVSVTSGDRVLVKDQDEAKQNGIRVVDTGGTWVRATDADTSAEVPPGMTVFVEQGTVNKAKNFVLVTPGPIVIGTTELRYIEEQSEVDARVFAAADGATNDFTALQSAFLTSNTVRLSPGMYRIGTAGTVGGAGKTLKIMRGATIQAEADGVEIHGYIDAAPDQQLFDGSFVASLDNVTNARIYPAWFGVLGDGTTDNQRSLEIIYDNVSPNATIVYLKGNYKIGVGATTTIAAGSNGAVLPQATINVVDTTNFIAAGHLYVTTSDGPQLVTYTGKTGTSFLGCSGGTGTMSTGGEVLPTAVLGTGQQNHLFDRGAVLLVQGESGVTMTSHIDALDDQQLFGGPGSVVFTPPLASGVPVGWFGANGDGVADNTAVFAKVHAVADDVIYPEGDFLVLSATIGTSLTTTHRFLQGARIVVGAGEDVVISGAIEAVDDQHIFVVPPSATLETPDVSSLSPHWFGAQGDDATDDTASFTKAAAALAGSGGVVRPLGRTYRLGNFTVPALVSIHGAGRQRTVLKAKAVGERAVVFAGVTGGAVLADLKDLTITQPNNATVSAVYAAGDATHILGVLKLENVYFNDCDFGGMEIGDYVVDVNFDHCLFANCCKGTTFQAALKISGQSTTVVLLNKCYFSNNRSTDVNGLAVDATALEFIRMVDCTVESSGGGVRVIAGAGLVVDRGYYAESLLGTMFTIDRGGSSIPSMVLQINGAFFNRGDINPRILIQNNAARAVMVTGCVFSGFGVVSGDQLIDNRYAPADKVILSGNYASHSPFSDEVSEVYTNVPWHDTWTNLATHSSFEDGVDRGVLVTNPGGLASTANDATTGYTDSFSQKITYQNGAASFISLSNTSINITAADTDDIEVSFWAKTDAGIDKTFWTEVLWTGVGEISRGALEPTTEWQLFRYRFPAPRSGGYPGTGEYFLMFSSPYYGQASIGGTVSLWIDDVQVVKTARVAGTRELYPYIPTTTTSVSGSILASVTKPGFMSAADKSKLDGIAASAAALTSSAPVDVSVAAAAVGVAATAARADHKHDLDTNFGSDAITTSGLATLGSVKITGLTTGVAHADADGDITSSTIVNADVDAAAAIAGTKISPDFGAQTIYTDSYAVQRVSGAFATWLYTDSTQMAAIWNVNVSVQHARTGYAAWLNYSISTGDLTLYSAASQTAGTAFSFTVALTISQNGTVDFPGLIKTNTVNEHTAASGVTVDGLLIKDGALDAAKWRTDVATWSKDTDDGAAGTTTAERSIGIRFPYAVTILSAYYIPNANLTADDVNFATLKVWKRDSAGGTQTAIASASTTTGGTGNWTAFAPETLGTISNASVAAGASLTFEITKTAGGVVVPAGQLVIEYSTDK